MHGRLLIELLVLTVTVVIAVIALWRCRPRPAARTVPPGPPTRDADEPRVLSVDLTDRRP
jgi:hypothetical protein